MATLQIRDLPEYIYNRLKEDAQRERRSLSQQTAYTLGKGLTLEFDKKKKRKQTLESIKQLVDETESLTLSDPSIMIREDRER